MHNYSYCQFRKSAENLKGKVPNGCSIARYASTSKVSTQKVKPNVSRRRVGTVAKIQGDTFVVVVYIYILLTFETQYSKFEEYLYSKEPESV